MPITELLLALKLAISPADLPKREPDPVVQVAENKGHRGSGRDKEDVDGKA